MTYQVGDEEEANRVAESGAVQSKLTAFFSLNASDALHSDLARTLTFAEVPKFFTYSSGAWKWRRNDYSAHVIGKVKAVLPRYIVPFAIRLLALNKRGPTSFEDLRTVDGTVHETFVDACKVNNLFFTLLLKN